jgi:hypothetical protein
VKHRRQIEAKAEFSFLRQPPTTLFNSQLFLEWTKL